MVDTLSSAQRSRCMARVKGKNTTPELAVRSLLHRLGYRFRLHRKDLPGRPDIVLPKYGVVIFVHGCFWHGHKGCPRSKRPNTNVAFWNEKLDRNARRDAVALRLLTESGWTVVVVWECETGDQSMLSKKLRRALR